MAFFVNDDDEIRWKRVFGALTTVGMIILGYLFYDGLYAINKASNYQVLQHPISGELTVKNQAGFYWTNFGHITTYRKVSSLDFDEENIKVRFNDGSEAGIKGKVTFRLPANTDLQKKLHIEYHDFNNVVQNLIKPNVEESLKQAATLMTAEESYSSGRTNFISAAEQQLKQGIFKTISKESDEEDGTVKRTIRIALDNNGDPIIQKPTLLKEYGIEITQFTVSDFEFDDVVKNLIAEKKKKEQEQVVSRSEAEKAKQEAITERERGEARIAKQRADSEVIKTAAVIEAQKKAEVAKLEAEQAKYEAQKIREQGAAEAYANELKVKAGLTPLEKAQIEKETAIGVAAEMAKIQFPQSMIIAGGSKDGSFNPVEALGFEALLNASRKMANQK